MDRRDFVKVSGAASLGLMLPQIGLSAPRMLTRQDNNGHIHSYNIADDFWNEKKPASENSGFKLLEIEKGIFEDVKDIFDIDCYDLDEDNWLNRRVYKSNGSSYALKNHGFLPEDNNEFWCPLYEIGSSVDAFKKYWGDSRHTGKRYDISSRMKKMLISSMRKKVKDDCFHTLMFAAHSPLNPTSIIYNGKLDTTYNYIRTTHIICSPELKERSEKDWPKSFPRLVDIQELGEGQEYQLFYEEYVAKKRCNEIFIGITDSDDTRKVCYPKVAPPVMARNYRPYYEPQLFGDYVKYQKEEKLVKEDRFGYFATARIGVIINGNGNAFIGQVNP